VEKKPLSIEQLAEKLGLKKASLLSPPNVPKKESKQDDTPKDSILSEETVKNPSSAPSSIIQKLREKLNETVSITSSPISHGVKGKRDTDFSSGTIIGTEDSQCLWFSEIYPHPYTYGEVVLSDALHFSTHELKISSAGTESLDFEVEKALFIDTETTSCFGGTGTVAFLVGIGYFKDNDFYLEQFFMRDYDDEPALLLALDERIKNASLFIGYNSKCFDLPLIRNRYRMNRLPFHGEHLFHFDLMHVARRFWNRRLRDCSLNTVEKNILKIRRYGDIPGAVIPRLWLNFIETGRTHYIPQILEHNRRDILSLAGLMAWLAQRVQIPKGQGFEEFLDRCALIRLQMKCNQHLQAVEIAEDLLQQTDYPPIRSECWKALSDIYRKIEKPEERLHILLQWAKEDKEVIYPRIELAKIYEHQQKDIEQALYWTNQALAIEPTNIGLSKRKKRLEKKMETIKNRESSDWF